MAASPILSDLVSTNPVQMDLVQIDLGPKVPARKPEWLKARAPGGEAYHALKKLARDLNLHTVCESAHCPNIGECWNQKAATFMMLGNLCTRRCGFCAVPKGRPEPIDHDEPRRVAYAVAQLGLSRTPSSPASTATTTISAPRRLSSPSSAEIRRQAPGTRVEVLTPDFQGNEQALRMVVNAAPEILNHNIETVPRLYRIAKSGGRYPRSLRFLEQAKADEPRPGHQDRHHRRHGRRNARAPRRSSPISPTARSISSPSASTSAPPATTSS